MPPPPGIIANFDSPYSLQRYDILCQTVCFTLTTLLLCIRLYTKIRVLRHAGWDDYVSLLAWVGLTTYMILNLEEDKHGNGRHIWNIRGSEVTKYAKLAIVSQIIYSPIIFLTKLSILLLYLRLFAPKRKIVIAIHLLLWANCIFYTIGFFVEIFQCTPRDKAINAAIPGHCINQEAAEIASAAINTFSDFAILLLPIATVWGLNMPTKKKRGILAIFGAGLFGCIASIVRMVIIVRNKHVVDVTWDWYPLNLWTTAEIACGIICGCLPALPAFVHYIRGQLKSESLPSTKSYLKENEFSPARYARQASPWQELDDTEGASDDDQTALKKSQAFKQGQEHAASEIRRQQEFVVAFPEVLHLSQPPLHLEHSERTG